MSAYGYYRRELGDHHDDVLVMSEDGGTRYVLRPWTHETGMQRQGDGGEWRLVDAEHVCRYCWAPVEPVRRSWRIERWPSFCDDTCRRLNARRLGAELSAKSVSLLDKFRAQLPLAVAS